MVRGAFLTGVVSSLALAATALPTFDLPTFDYQHLEDDTTPSRVLDALQEGGILALRNIPNYANVRERYLATAVDCALAMESDEHSQHVSIKQFADGTRRLTLRSNAGRELEDLVETSDLATKCPGYHDVHREFSRTLERVVMSFAAALDGTSFRMSDGDRILTSRQLFSDAVRLDHFHAYEAAVAPAAPETERELSLLLHEDHGMFIAMSAPAFFDVDADGAVTRRSLESDDSGLLIRKGGEDEESMVRPVLKDNELVLMAGTGFAQWLEGTHEIPAVMHGMRMPAELVGTQAAGHRHLRAWFGKMTLLPPHQRMLRGNGVAFDEFTNMTARHLLASTNGVKSEDLKTVGCAGGRRLVVSEGSCAFRLCKPRPAYANTTIFPSCERSCNYEYPSQSQVDRCNTKCECTGTTMDAGICWMTCAAWLPESECPLDRQYCLGLAMKCAAPGEPVTHQPLSPHDMPPKLTYHPVTQTPSPLPMTPPPSDTSSPPPSTSAPPPLTTNVPPPSTSGPVTPVEPVPSPSAPEPAATPRPQC